jgi:hypothetical protein
MLPGLLQHTLRLPNDLFTQRRDRDLVRIALEELDLKLF